MTLPSFGSYPAPPVRHVPRSFVTDCTVCGDRRPAPPGSRISTSNVISSALAGRSMTSRARTIDGCRRTISATCIGWTNMPRTLADLVGPAEPAADALVGAAARAAAGQHRRQIAGGEADQRVFRGQRGDHDLADLARRDRVAGAGLHEFEDDALVEHHALANRAVRRRALIGDQAEIGGAVALQRGDPARRGTRRATPTGNASAPTSALLSERDVAAVLGGAVEQDLQKRRRADIGDRLQIGDRRAIAARSGRCRPG